MLADALLPLARRLHDARDLESVMDMVVSAVRERTRYRRAWLNVLSEDGASMEVVGYAVDDLEMIRQRVPSIQVQRDEFLRNSFLKEEPVIIEDMRLDPLADQRQVEFFGNRTVIMVPMVRLAERIGSFNVGTFGDEGVLPPTQDEVDFFLQVASLVSVVVGRLRAEEATRALEEKMRNTQRLEALGRLAGEVSHDFNNVLLSIVGNADLIADELTGHPALELVREIQDAAARASRLTRQLLAFSRGQLLDRRSHDLYEIVDGLGSMLRRLLPSSVRLEVSRSGEQTQVWGDGGQLEQVVMNLVLNARDAFSESGGAIRVEVGEATGPIPPGAPAGRYVRLAVTDEGVGMSPEVVARIFEPFFSTKPSHQGTGLGLAVVDSIAKQHEALVHVKSEPGRGTTFEVFFPRAEPSEPPAPSATASSKGPTRAFAHILVVDDDPAVRALLERVLCGSGYRVTAAEDGERALERFEEFSDVALVITDLVMPGVAGAELVAKLQLHARAPRIIVMTGYARGMLTELGAAAHLTKPFTPSDLLELVHRSLD